MIADKVVSSTSAQDSDSWEPVEFDTNTNESLEPSDIGLLSRLSSMFDDLDTNTNESIEPSYYISSDALPGFSSAKKLEDLDAKITNLEGKFAQQNKNIFAQIECSVNENFSLKSSTKKLKDLDTKIAQLEENLAQQNNNTVTQIERLLDEVMSLKDIVSSNQKESHDQFKDLKDKAILDRSEIIHNIKELKKDIETLAEENTEALDHFEDLLYETQTACGSFKTEAEGLSLMMRMSRNIFTSERRPHDFGPLQQGWSHGCHGRVCSRCGIAQLYGRKYGSKRNPGYEQIDETCIPSS